MRLSIIKFIFILLPFITQGQQIYFNRGYNFNQGDANCGFGIIPYDNKEYLGAFTTDDNGNPFQLSLCFLDSDGNILQRKIYAQPNANIYISGNSPITSTSDNGYAIATSYQYSISNSNVVLYKFNHFGDTLWTKEYGDTLFQSAFQCRQTRDGGFIIAGQTGIYNPLYNDDMLLIKTDSMGNLQWQNHYGGTDDDIAVSVDTCFDGGYVIAGGTQSYGANAFSSFPNAYIVKVDSIGHFQWQQVFGGIYGDDFWQVIQARDSTIIAGGVYTDIDHYAHCCGGFSKPYIVKLDLSGNVIWTKSYGDSLFGTGLFTLKELPNGDLIGAGEVEDVNNFFQQRGLVLKTNKYGDSLLYRIYSILSLHSSEELDDISYDYDKGFICTGVFYPSSPDTGTQDVWVLKLDSNGCEVANCLNSVGIDEPKNKSRDIINIYPNPTNSQATMEANIPNNSKVQQVVVTDIIGQQLRTYGLQPGYNTVTISMENMRSGMYFLYLLSDGKILSAVRLIKTD